MKFMNVQVQRNIYNFTIRNNFKILKINFMNSNKELDLNNPNASNLVVSFILKICNLFELQVIAKSI